MNHMHAQDTPFSKLRLILRYLSYRIRAVNAHSLHSPFLFNLYTEAISRQEPDAALQKLDALRRDLRKETRSILCTPLGTQSGPQIQRKISDFARDSGKSIEMVHLLYRLARYLNPKSIIELGTGLGISTSYLAAGAGDARIVTVEGCPATATEAQKHFESACLNDIQQITGNFDDVLPELLENYYPVDLLFIDGNHTREATLRYFQTCLPYTGPSSLIIVDDIHWSPGMEAAWEDIKQHPDVTITLDLFHLGLVFFRKESSWEDFVVIY